MTPRPPASAAWGHITMKPRPEGRTREELCPRLFDDATLGKRVLLSLLVLLVVAVFVAVVAIVVDIVISLLVYQLV